MMWLNIYISCLFHVHAREWTSFHTTTVVAVYSGSKDEDFGELAIMYKMTSGSSSSVCDTTPQPHLHFTQPTAPDWNIYF